AHRCVLSKLFRSKLVSGDEHSERDGKVKRTGVLAKVGGGEVDDTTGAWSLVAEVGKGSLDAVDALLDRHFREADEDGLFKTARDVNLHLYRHGVDPHERERVQLGEHGRPPRQRADQSFVSRLMTSGGVKLRSRL